MWCIFPYDLELLAAGGRKLQQKLNFNMQSFGILQFAGRQFVVNSSPVSGELLV